MKKCFIFLFCVFYLLPVAALAGGSESAVYPLYTTFLLGGWQGDGWKTADDIASYVPAGMSWWLYNLKGQAGRLNGRQPIHRDELGGYYDIEFYEADNESSVHEGEIATGNLDTAMPRLPKLQTGGLKIYEAEIRNLLDKKGLKQSKVVFSEVVRCDLDGDGSEEVIIVAQTADAKVPAFRCGTYSIVLFRHLVRGKVETIVIKEQYYLKDITGEANSPDNYSVPFIIDANANGTMEVILQGQYYEGSWYEIYEYRNHTLTKVLEAGVGA